MRDRNTNTIVNTVGSGGGRLESGELASPQQTWTAGMTKGVPPPELVAQLKRNRSAPTLDDQEVCCTISESGSADPSQSVCKLNV